MEIMEASIPTVTVHTRRNLPWLTKPILQAMRRCNSLYKSPSVLQKFHAARNRVTAMLRQSKSTFFAQLATSSKKQFWKAVKSINKTDCSIPTLHDGSKLVDGNRDKAIVLNNYFYSCFSTSQPPLDRAPDPLEPATCPADIFVLKMKYLTLWLLWISLSQQDQTEYLRKC